jgi:thioredoxin-like negative regulator of GroEL
MPTRRGFLAAPAVLAAALAGCGGSPDAKAPAVPGVELTEITTAGLERAVAEQKGKVVLLDVWALS